MTDDLELCVLGPLVLRCGGVPLEPGAPKQRSLLAALALTPGHAVAVDTLVDLLWGERPPPGVLATVQAYVSGLRKVLEPGRERRAPARVLVTQAPGYALRLGPDACDAHRFERVVTREHRKLVLPLLGPSPVPARSLETAVAVLDEVLGLWRGQPYAELGDLPAVLAERAHLEELRVIALEDRAAARLALGDHATAAAELETLTGRHPLRERLWALRVLALLRSGRQADALDALARVRSVLADELGLDPGAELRDLQARVLAQDPALSWSAPAPEETTAGEPHGPRAARGPAARREPGGEVARAEGLESGWPLFGRDDELARLMQQLDRADAGEAGFGVVTGEPGIGKSRLCAELAARARSRGATVLVGRCSQDDGAPPLWPWELALRTLARGVADDRADDRPGDQGVGDQPHDNAREGDFAAWSRTARTVLEAARDTLVLVVLDDLHWSDTASLRVLRLLVEQATTERLLIVATWRDRPVPSGALADAAESLARAHAQRVELTGLDASSVAGILDALGHRHPTDHESDALRRRTDGNPFFLVEYARLAAARPDLGGLIDGEERPRAVQDVLTRRIGRLPEPTRQALSAASVIGRRFDLPLLAATTGTDADDVLDVLEPAQVAGLVTEEAADVFVFEHALVRDTAYDAVSPTRRARGHAAVARALEARGGHATEIARHWLAAGPAHAPRAWRAGAAAGGVALRAHAHPEAASLFDAALERLGDDPGASVRDRYDLLVQRAVAERWGARWSALTATVEDAVRTAGEIGDPVLAAEAATLTVRGALWQSARHSGVHDHIVSALRRSLEVLPAGDSPVRCRCLLGLALELYYVSTPEERRVLVDDGIAMARRLGDRALLIDALSGAFNALWTPGHEAERLRHADESLALAREVGDEHAEGVALTQRAIVLCELGRPDEMWATYHRAVEVADRLRLLYALVVLKSLVVPWHAMAGRFDECHRLFGEVVGHVEQADLSQAEEALAGVVGAMTLWDPAVSWSEEAFATSRASPLPTESTLAFILWRQGEQERARQWLVDNPARLEDQDWFAKLNWGFAAAVAAFTGAPPLARRAYELLSPYAGQACTAGSGFASGPVDAYLALAASATGDLDRASRHADAAELLSDAWGIPLFAQWFRDERARLGF